MAEDTLTLRSKQPHAPLPVPPNAPQAQEAKPVDPNDPMERARRRAAELREHGSFDPGTDKFALIYRSYRLVGATNGSDTRSWAQPTHPIK